MVKYYNEHLCVQFYVSKLKYVFVHVHAYILGSLEYFKTPYLIKVEMYIYPHHI